MNSEIPSEEAVREALRQVIDPEVGVNIVDLGLIYEISTGAGRIHVRMTMTTPACPLGPYLTDSVTDALHQCAPNAEDINVELVWDPPWEPAMMSEDAKKQLGWSDE